MSTFFSDIQGFFKEQFDGRYIGIVLAEVSRVDPGPFRRFFAEVFHRPSYLEAQLAIDPEFSFRTPTGLRRADLVVTLDGLPAALVELKFYDKLIPSTRSTPTQLSDYLRVCRSEGFDFLLLSREPPTFAQIEEIRGKRQHFAHFSQLAERLRASRHPASQMLFEFLREKGVVSGTLEPGSLVQVLP